MGLGHPKRSRRSRNLLILIALGSLGAVCFPGCEKGLGPTELIRSDGSPADFLPPGGVAPGATHEVGLLYFYDTQQYREYFRDKDPKYPDGTDERFIKRGVVLSKLGATIGERRRPDLVDATLAAVYGNPRLFGFEPAADGEPGFRAGARLLNADEFFPLAEGGGPSWWEYNHVQLQWVRKDTLIGPETSPSPTSMGGPEWRLRSINRVRADLRNKFLPSLYNSDLIVSSIPGVGVFFHGYHLVAERDEVVPEGEFRVPEQQRNPRFLWLWQRALGNPDPNSPVVTTIDQCLDGLWGRLDMFPVQLTGAHIQVGDRYTTWTYVTVDSTALRLRVQEGTEREQLRCSGSGVVPEDVPLESAAFPTFFFSLLARYQIDAEEVFDQLVWFVGNDTVGKYGTVDGVPDVIKFVVRVYLGAPVEGLVQKLDLYYQRNVGLVVQVTGNRLASRDITRLRRAMVNGQEYTEEDFSYLP
ncbi:MAG: hypothetical protein ACE5G2_11500 [Candidatus Krumholzibacteriia bacterium]